MNVMSMGRLHLPYSGNGPRVKNKQRNFVELVKWRRKDVSGKAYLNIVRARPNIEWDDKVSKE